MNKTIVLLIILILSGLLLNGCVEANVTQIIAPDGQKGYTIKCNGTQVEKCYNAAGTTCPKGYSIISNDTTHFEDITFKYLVIQCK